MPRKKKSAPTRAVKRTIKTRRTRRAVRGPSKGPVTRKSQANRKAPARRLLKRRARTRSLQARGIAGFYANPIKHGYDVTAGRSRIATFRTLPHAKEYARQFANKHRVQVKIAKT